MADNSSETGSETLMVRWDDTARFVRQLSHDLRNDLNAIELQSAYISELTQDQELTNEIKRLREVISALSSTLRVLSRAVAEVIPNVVAYPAREFLIDMRTLIERSFPKQRHEITWDVQIRGGTLKIDPQLFQEVFVELFANAFQHDRGAGPLLASATIDDGRLLFTLREPKPVFASATQNWGREPLCTIGPRHYGLGLNRARTIIEAHRGELQVEYDPRAATLVSIVAVPLSSADSEHG